MNFTIKSRYRMAILLLYSFRIMSAGRNSMSAGRDLLFQFDKSRNLSFSIVFGFKMIIFAKIIVYYRFYGFLLDFYQIFIIYYRISIEFYCFRTIQYVRGTL